MKAKLFLLATAFSVLLSACTFIRSYVIRGSWELQEVQIPLTEDYEPYTNYDYYQRVSITDHSFEVWDSEFRLVDRWSYTLNNDSVLTLSSGCMYKNLVISRVTKNQLVLSDEQTTCGRIIYIFVPMGDVDGPIKHTKHHF